MGTPTHSHDRGRADGPDDRRADAGDDPQEIRDIGGDPASFQICSARRPEDRLAYLTDESGV